MDLCTELYTLSTKMLSINKQLFCLDVIKLIKFCKKQNKVDIFVVKNHWNGANCHTIYKKKLRKYSLFGILECMIKRINIAGIELDNYTVREMLMKIERHFDENSFTTIEEINMDTFKVSQK